MAADDLDPGIGIDDGSGAAIVELYFPDETIGFNDHRLLVGGVASKEEAAKPDGEGTIFQGKYIFIPNVPNFAGLW